MIMDVLNDNLIPYISKKNTIKEMLNAMVILYQSENINMKMILSNNIRFVEMTVLDIVTSYLMKVIQICDQHKIVGEKV